MRGLSTKFRIAIGQTGIIITLIMAAFYLDFVPDRLSAVRHGRASLAESIAINTALLVTKPNPRQLEEYLKIILERNSDILSAAMRKIDSKSYVVIGDHERHWVQMSTEYSTDSQIRVPIWARDQKWGHLELRYTPLSRDGWYSFLDDPMIQLVVFLGGCSFLIFYFYLGRMLKHLDPSQAIPGRVRSALDTMAEGLLILDRKEHIVLANQAFADILGKTPEKLMGLKAGELPWFNQDGKKIIKEDRPWLQALDAGIAQKNRLLCLKLTDQETLSFLCNSSPVLGAGKKHAGVLVSFDDVTKLQETEIELRKSKKEAEEANRSKSEFLANMSHEIRTPMNAILGFAEILKRGYVKNEKESFRYLSLIHSSGANLIELINDILDLSKVESGHMEIETISVEPYRIINEVVQMLSSKADEKGILLEFKVNNAVPQSILTDPARLRQIVFNLTGNAIKFTEKGGVTVVCSYENDNNNSYLYVEVIDTGIGMEQDRVEAIFDPFVQADTSTTRKFGGTGLGLAISRKLARTMGGDIQVKSQIGEGSIFKVCLTTGDLDGVAFLEPESLSFEVLINDGQADKRWRFSKANILVVDDGAENRELVRLLLEEAGLFVDEAENGLIGFEKVISNNYDVVLMDVQMPIMDGFEAAQKIRENGYDVPIIALTANAMKGFEQQCLDAGYSDYLSKPINIDQFMAKMAELLDGHQVEIDFEVSEESKPASKNETDVQAKDKLPAIVSTLAGKKDRYNSLIDKFIEQLNIRIVELKQAAQKNDYKKIADLAHWLKGTGGTVGFKVFTEPAAKLENHAKNSNLVEINKSIPILEDIASRIISPSMSSEISEENIPITPPESDPNAESENIQTENLVKGPIESRLAKFPKFHSPIIKFTNKLEEELVNMEQAIKDGEHDKLAKIAHWLKGAGGTVGYDDLTEPALQLEEYAKQQQPEQAEQMIKILQQMCQALVVPEVEKN